MISYTYNAIDNGAAWKLGQQINDAINGVTRGQVLLVDAPTVYEISNVTPNPFDILVDTVTFNLTGLVIPLIGRLYVEDLQGGQDSNGYYMTCSYVSPTTLRAAFTSVGDSDLGPGPVLIYYQDSLGSKSNVISATNTVDTTITIP